MDVNFHFRSFRSPEGFKSSNFSDLYSFFPIDSSSTDEYIGDFFFILIDLHKFYAQSGQSFFFDLVNATSTISFLIGIRIEFLLWHGLVDQIFCLPSLIVLGSSINSPLVIYLY